MWFYSVFFLSVDLIYCKNTTTFLLSQRFFFQIPFFFFKCWRQFHFNCQFFSDGIYRLSSIEKTISDWERSAKKDFQAVGIPISLKQNVVYLLASLRTIIYHVILGRLNDGESRLQRTSDDIHLLEREHVWVLYFPLSHNFFLKAKTNRVHFSNLTGTSQSVHKSIIPPRES